jgi:hypothetical protein
MQIKFFKKEKNFKKEKESFWLNVNLYWRFAVCFMFVVFLLSFLFGYYLFRQINQEPVLSSSDASPQIGTVNKEKMKKVLEYFSLREQKSIQILNSPSPVVDPSL